VWLILLQFCSCSLTRQEAYDQRSARITGLPPENVPRSGMIARQNSDLLYYFVVHFLNENQRSADKNPVITIK
jgi:hypothetical protein